eukprot:5045830-Pleurochrysis_carterae.AAC.1
MSCAPSGNLCNVVAARAWKTSKVSMPPPQSGQTERKSGQTEEGADRRGKYGGGECGEEGG